MNVGGEIIDLVSPAGRAKAFALPEGKTCADCFALMYCTGIGCTKPENTRCDWYPVRFREGAARAQKKEGA